MRRHRSQFDPVTGAPIRERTVEIHDAEFVDDDRDVRRLERLRAYEQLRHLEHLRSRRQPSSEALHHAYGRPTYERPVEMAPARSAYAPAPMAPERSFALGVLVGFAGATLALLWAPSRSTPPPPPPPTPPDRRPGER